MILPVASTLNTPPGGVTLEVLEELTELGVLEREELTELGVLEREELIELGVLEREELIELGVLEREELTELLVTLTLDETPQLAVTPKGEGWLVQVVLEIQLLLFS